MLLKRINIISLLLFFLFFAGCVSSPSTSSVRIPREGKGTITYPNGSKYVGEFKAYKFNGQGTLTWSDGTEYVGGFKDSWFNGQGTLTWSDGTEYVGGFKDGMFNGQGILIWPDGLKYIGLFRDFGSNISGKYFLRNGTSVKGKLVLSAYIHKVLKDSQAEKIGLHIGDIVTHYNEIPLTNGLTNLINLVKATKPKEKVKLNVLRDDTENIFVLNGGRIGIGITDYPKIPENVIKEIEIATIQNQAASQRYKIEVSGKRWAVIIGISEYKDSRIPSLRYAAKDAISFNDWLISTTGGKLAPSRVKLLLNQDATGKKIKKALYEWLKQPLDEDFVTIYFAGHGSPESPDSQNNLFLLPYDTQYDSIASTGFPMWDIETALKRFIRAKKVLVIADACHSGGVGHAFDMARRSNRGIQVNRISSGLQNLAKIGDGICVISSADDNQFSQEHSKWGGGHGVFTYCLLKGLKGEADYNEDGKITIGEIIPYLSENVRRETLNAQSPVVSGKFDPALSIGK